MRFAKSIIQTALFFLLINFISYSQTKTISVWPNKIPGAIENSNVKENIILTETGAERIANVTNPTIAIYFPAKEKANGSAIIICPGGGYGRLAMPHEGNDVAAWLNELGIIGIVLKYRLPNDAIMENKMIAPLMDVQEAVRIVRRNSAEWNINPTKIGVMGFSAGGHLASTIATSYSTKVYESDSVSARPDFSILIYPVISMNLEITHKGSRKNLLGENPEQKYIDQFSSELNVTQNTPPVFIVHAADDASVPVQNSINYFLSLKKNNVSAELHIYQTGGHGFGFGKKGSTESNWPNACVSWMKVNGFCQ